VDRYDLPPEVVTAWERTAAAYASYVGLVAVFDELDADHWTRWHALRQALPGVPHAVLKSLLAALSGVPTETLTALCGHQSGAVA
jgi:predicted component of type VI protein secretion system